jgi:hypothetical protein
MVQAIAGADALKGRRVVKSTGTGEEHWRTDFIGQRGEGKLKNEPQAFLIEMTPNEVIVPHFHEVDQYQIFVAGGGSLGRATEVANPLAVHYADHHTGYGPINAGPQGFSYFTLRAKTDPGAVYLHQPGYREKLKPSRKRHFLTQVTLSTEPVLLDRRDAALEPLSEEQDQESDGLGAWLLRAGPGVSVAGPSPAETGGQHYLVVNGALALESRRFPAWSTIFLSPDEPPLQVNAWSSGVEVLILQYPREASPS